MAEQASGCFWALQKPAPPVPSQAGAALHPGTRLPACLPASLPACLPACLPPPSAAGQGPGSGVAEALQEHPGNTVWRKPRRSPIPGLLKAAPGLAPRPPRLPSRTARHLAVRHHTTLGCSLGRGWKRARAIRPLLPSGPAPPGSQRLFPSPRASAASHQAFPPVCPTWCKPPAEPPAPPDNKPARVRGPSLARLGNGQSLQARASSSLSHTCWHLFLGRRQQKARPPHLTPSNGHQLEKTLATPQEGIGTQVFFKQNRLKVSLELSQL